MNIGKKVLLMSISIVSVGLIANSANAYQPVYGNDYANITSYGINEDDFKRDNIIQRNGNQTTVNIPKPKGTVDINILGAKRTIELDDDEEKRLNKRKRYFKIQKRKKAKRLEEQRKFAEIQEKRKIEDMKIATLKAEEKAKKMEAEAKENALNIQNQQFQRNLNNDLGNGFIPSTPPIGIP